MASSTPSRQPLRRTALLRNQATVAGRALIIAVAVAALLWFLMRISVVTVAAFFGFSLAALLWPVVDRLRKVMPQGLAVALSVVGGLGVIGTALWFLGSQLVKAWPALSDAFAGGVGDLSEWAAEAGAAVPPGVEDDIRRRLAQAVADAGSAAAAGLGALGTFATIVGLTLFVTVFALSGGDDLARSAAGLLPRHWRVRALASLRAMVRTARAWLGASTLTGIGDALLIGGGLWFLGVPLAFPIAMLTFFAGFIPTIGAFLAGVVAVAVALFSGGMTTALWTLLLVVVVQQIQGNVLEPLLLSRAMEFHPLVTLLLTTTGGLLFGIVGLILTVPVAGFLASAVAAWQGPDGGDADPDDSEPGESDADDSEPGADEPREDA